MTDYTARNVLLKDANGNYLIPYTEKADLSLSNLNASGKAYVAIKGYDSTTTYSLNEVVMTIVSGSVLFYKSLVNNNTSALSDTTKWEAVSFGGGANTDLSNLSTTGNAKFQSPITGAATTITSSNLTASCALVSDSNGKVAVSSVTSAELGYVSGVTSAIQTQIDGKVSSVSPALTGTPTAPTAASTVNNTQIATTAYVVAHRCTTAATTASSASIYKPAIVIENYRNGNQWYRKWSDGWIEQGGLASSNLVDVNQTVNLVVAFTTTNYSVVASPGAAQGNNDLRHCAVFEKGTTYFKFVLSSTKMWRACGY